LAGLWINEVSAGGARAEVDPIGHYLHPVSVIAPPQGEGARIGGDGVLDDMRGDVHPHAVHPGADRSQQSARFGVEHVDAGAVQALQRRLIHLLDLAIRQNVELRGLMSVIVDVHNLLT
jgi:hypothetical protein